MADNIVTRLRTKYSGQLPICAEAADELERLRTLIVEWVEADDEWHTAYEDNHRCRSDARVFYGACARRDAAEDALAEEARRD